MTCTYKDRDRGGWGETDRQRRGDKEKVKGGWGRKGRETHSERSKGGGGKKREEGGGERERQWARLDTGRHSKLVATQTTVYTGEQTHPFHRLGLGIAREMYSAAAVLLSLIHI